MTINGVQWGIGNMSVGGGHLNACPGGRGGLEGKNRSLSRGNLQDGK